MMARTLAGSTCSTCGLMFSRFTPGSNVKPACRSHVEVADVAQDGLMFHHAACEPPWTMSLFLSR